MKVEVLRARMEKFGLSLHDRLVGYLPRYAPYAARYHRLMNMRDRVPGAAKLSEWLTGFSARRSLPKWREKTFEQLHFVLPIHEEPAVVLFVDTFNRYFEPENLKAAIDVLNETGYVTNLVDPTDGAHPLCCGRTFLAVGKVDEARREAERTLVALAPYVERGVPVIGLEPSCIYAFRDEIPALIRSDTAKLVADHAFLFEEFLASENKANRFVPDLEKIGTRALLHGHCHQKSFGAMSAIEHILKLIPDLAIETVESSCCGMAGAFGYDADTIDVSFAMGELSLLPAVRKADADTIIVADGTSCRQQIHDGTGREALHVARVLARSIQANEARTQRIAAEHARSVRPANQ
jgi:Fe-S oxidoreductase